MIIAIGSRNANAPGEQQRGATNDERHLSEREASAPPDALANRQQQVGARSLARPRVAFFSVNYSLRFIVKRSRREERGHLFCVFGQSERKSQSALVCKSARNLVVCFVSLLPAARQLGLKSVSIRREFARALRLCARLARALGQLVVSVAS